MTHASKLLWLGSFAGLLVASAAHAEPRKPTHVACVGDSITAGGNYVSLLQGSLGNGVQVKNFGRSGATLLSEGYGDLPYNKQVEYTAATDFVTNAGAGSVVSVVIILGANDSKPYNWEPANKPKNDQQYKTDYLALVDHFLSLPTKPVVYVGYPLATGTNPCCSIRGDVIYEQQIPLIKQVATMRRLPIIDLNTATTNHPEYFGDGVHPNDAGYVVMANLVKMGLDREPLVSITSPTAGAMTGFGVPVPLTADAGDSTVDFASVEFFEGATSLGKATAKPFTVNWTPGVGNHTITATAIDTTLASGTSDPLMFSSTGDALPSGGSGAGGAGATAGTPNGGGMAAAGAPTGMAGSAMSSAGSSSAGSSGNGATAPESDAGCGCAVPGSRGAGTAGWLIVAASLLALKRRRAA